MTEQGPGGAAPAGGWRDATVAEVVHPGAHGVRLRLDVDRRVPHLPGQHYVVRLVAPDGYVAQRSYSIASDPSDPLVELYVERLVDGEVSPFLADAVVVGDELTLRGPIGGWFVWGGDEPMLGVGGGTGVVPLVAMLRHASALGRRDLVRLVVAARSIDDLPYATELLASGAFVALSRAVRGERPAGRLTAGELAPLVAGRRRCYVCGSHAFAEGVSQMLVGIGVPPGEIRIERFGPSG